MIWLCGDTHGLHDIAKIERFFSGPEAPSGVTKQDSLIILGDAGVLWDGGEGDRLFQKRLSALPCRVLWIDGNHENFYLLGERPVTENWNGGRVHRITEDIIHLMRGQIFTLEGHTFFTFGGGYSIDRGWRVTFVSWWPQEMPGEPEYLAGKEHLAGAGHQVDYILTHTAPERMIPFLTQTPSSGEIRLQRYLEEVASTVSFRRWYFGHWHQDVTCGSFRCLWEDIVPLGE